MVVQMALAKAEGLASQVGDFSGGGCAARQRPGGRMVVQMALAETEGLGGAKSRFSQAADAPPGNAGQ